MSATAGYLADPELLGTEWDLGPLVDGGYDPGVERPLEQANAPARPGAHVAAEHAPRHTGVCARLVGEPGAALRVELDDGELTLDVACSRLQDPTRETRRAAAEAVTAAREPGRRTRAFISNTLVQDK